MKLHIRGHSELSNHEMERASQGEPTLMSRLEESEYEYVVGLPRITRGVSNFIFDAGTSVIWPPDNSISTIMFDFDRRFDLVKCVQR